MAGTTIRKIHDDYATALTEEDVAGVAETMGIYGSDVEAAGWVHIDVMTAEFGMIACAYAQRSMRVGRLLRIADGMAHVVYASPSAVRAAKRSGEDLKVFVKVVPVRLVYVAPKSEIHADAQPEKEAEMAKISAALNVERENAIVNMTTMVKRRSFKVMNRLYATLAELPTFRGWENGANEGYPHEEDVRTAKDKITKAGWTWRVRTLSEGETFYGCKYYTALVAVAPDGWDGGLIDRLRDLQGGDLEHTPTCEFGVCPIAQETLT